MCGRYNFYLTTGMLALFEELEVPSNLTDRPNITPTDSVPIIIACNQSRECHLAHWWLIPRWSSGFDRQFSMYNARAENLESSRAFKYPFHHRRCIMPASSFIEWQTTGDDKQPYEIFRNKQQPIVFAGLWDEWNNEILSCAMITTKAASALTTIHPRMPVILNKQGIKKWLNPDSNSSTLFELLTDQVPYPLQAQPVDKSINNGKAKTPPTPVGSVLKLAL